ncbi:MAG TPA: O-antigen ligase family protein [bacterium]|nr:O-antigen ligase family protein [bacterium]
MVSRFIERRQQADWNLEAAIQQTIAYFSLFKYPLSQWEIWSFLPQKTDFNQVRTTVAKMVEQGLLMEKWGYYFLPGQSETVECRGQRYPMAIRKIKIAKRVVAWLRWLPGIRFVAVANLMGAYNLRDGGDIDLFIVAQPGCLWVCRFWAALILQIFGLRPTPENSRDKICLSFWLASNNLKIDQFKLADEAGCPDWYYIYWLANLRPLVEQGLTYSQLIKSNPWLKTYLPNWRPGQYEVADQTLNSRLAKVFSRLNCFLAKPFERLFFYLQQKFLPIAIKTLMNLDQRVVVNEKTIKLHTIDRRRNFRDRLQTVLEGLKVGKIEKIKADPLSYQLKINWLSRLNEFFCLGLCLVLPWSTRLIIKAGSLGGEYFEYGTISLYLSDIFLIAAILTTFCVHFRKGRFSRLGKMYLLWLVGLLTIIGVGFFNSTVNYQLRIFYWLRLFLWSFGWWFLLRLNYWPIKKWLSYVALGLVIPAFLGIGQFFTQTAPANKWLGLAAHYSGDLGTSVIESLGSGGEITGRWLRAYGSFDQPNILGGLMAVAIILVIVGWPLFNSNFIRSLLFGALAVWCLAALFSWSRAGWLAMIVGLVLAVILAWSEKLRRRKILWLASFLIAWTILWLWPFNELINSRVSLATRLEQKSLTERADGYQMAATIIKQKPFLGIGLGNYTQVLSQQDKEVGPAWQYQPVHNTLVLIMAEIGYGGFIWLVGGWCLALWQTRKKAFVWPLAVSIFCLMMLDHWWWSLHIGIVFLWFFSAAIFSSSRYETKLL